MNSKRAVNAKKLIKDYDITLRRLENAAEKLQSDLCVYGMFEPEEMCKLEDSFEETFKKLHAEEKAAAERKKPKKPSRLPAKMPTPAQTRRISLQKNGQIREESLIKKQKMIL